MAEASLGETGKVGRFAGRQELLYKLVNFNWPDEERRSRGASLNQKLARDFLEIMNEPEDVQEGKAQELIAGLRAVAFGKSEDVLIDINRIIAGARAQAGVMDCLRRNGFSVIIPTTFKETDKIDLNRVDVAVVQRDTKKIYLIDVKAENQTESGQRKEASVEPQKRSGKVAGVVFNGISTSGRASKVFMESAKEGFPYAFVRVVVPTGNEFMELSGRLSEKTGNELLEGLSTVEVKNWV